VPDHLSQCSIWSALACLSGYSHLVAGLARAGAFDALHLVARCSPVGNVSRTGCGVTSSYLQTLSEPLLASDGSVEPPLDPELDLGAAASPDSR